MREFCLEGKSMTPHQGEYCSLPFLPATPSSPSRTLEGLFELTRRPLRALDSPRALLPELQRNKDTVRLGRTGIGREKTLGGVTSFGPVYLLDQMTSHPTRALRYYRIGIESPILFEKSIVSVSYQYRNSTTRKYQ